MTIIEVKSDESETAAAVCALINSNIEIVISWLDHLYTIDLRL